MKSILKLKFSILFIVIIAMVSGTYAGNTTIHGYIKDKANGEALIGANIYVKGTSTGTITNEYGFYSLSLPNGIYTIGFSFIGYQQVEQILSLDKDQVVNVELSPETENIEEVIVTSQKKNENITSTQMSVQKLDATTIKSIPVMFGETDVIKTLKLLPGVVGTSELSSNLSIRGGTRDQNLVQLDEATVYNASHLLGIFSVFNNDAIKSVELYKGIMPAQYGGRISSLIDIRMKEGNTKKFAGVGSIGLITSKLTFEGPIVKDKGSFIVSGRRTYLDLITKLMHKASPEKVKNDLPIFFYDFNAKANYTINDNNRLYLSGYFGEDFANLSFGSDTKQNMSWNNYTTTLRWNHLFSEKIFSNFTFLANSYKYKIDIGYKYGKDDKNVSFLWEALLKDYTAKADLGYYINPKNKLRFGVSSTFHDFNVGKIKSVFDTTSYNFAIPKYYSIESAAYIGNEQKAGRFTFDYGFRATLFQNIGKATVYGIENYDVTDTTYYKKGKIFNHYLNFEPRASLTFVIDDKNSIKAGYARTFQYMHIASNSQAGTPLDIWMPVGENVKPQKADQVSVGYFRNFLNNSIQISSEVYYKYMQNQIDFREFSQPYLNPTIEEEFRFGEGRAYGFELMAKKSDGKINGWVSYTLSKSERKIKDIQVKDWFLSPFDITNNISVVANYQYSKRVTFSANWVYMTGHPFNAPARRYEYGNLVLPDFNGRNTSRFPDYHRLDLGVEIKTKPKKRYESSWNFSIYNAYNQKNPNSIYFESDDENIYSTNAKGLALLKRIISVSWDFKF